MSEGETGGPSIRIFLSYHKNSARVKSSILTPIHVGRAIASDSVKSELSDIIGDDTDDNISELNPSFCELTAQYWAWKNTNYDYTGFFHYRRHLIFSDDNFKEDIYGLVNYPYVTSDYLKKAGLDDRTIESKIKGYDLIVAERWNVTNAGSKDNYDHYKSSSPYLHISDYDKMIEILLKRYPDYAEDVEAYNRSKYGYYTNMFIMKRPLFEDYCNFLFSILFELSRKVDISGYNVQEKRIFGYLSEWILGIYVFHYLRVVKRPVLELKRAFIRYPDVESGYLNICSSCDNNYARHLGVFLVSIKANKGDEKIHYWVFSDGISDYNRKKIASLGSDDFKITILNAEKNSISGLESTLATNPHLSLSAYNKLFLPDYVPMNIETLLYLDADMICRGSLAELFSTDFEGNYVCGVKDILCKENCKRLHLSMYINSGLLLMKCSAWRSEGISDLFRDYITKNIHNRNAIFYQDQDVVNKVLAGHILYIDNKWNAQTSSFSGSAEQNEIGKTAIIIHFISSRKPWMRNSGNPFESEYTKYFEISPWSREPRYLKSADRPRKKNPVSKSFSRFSNAVLDEYGLNFFTERMLRFDILIGNPKDLNRYFDKSYGNDERVKDAFDLTLEYAKKGNPHAMVRVARAYKDGRGVQKDCRESFKWYSGVISQGKTWCYSEYESVLPGFYDESYKTKDPQYWSDLFNALIPLAEDGNPDAAVRIARAYKDAHGVGRDLKKSLECYSKAADLGSSGAKEALGSVKEEIEENNRKKLVLFDVSHYSFLTEAVIIRANRHEDDNSVLMITKKTGKEEFIKKLRASNIFNIVIEYNPFFGINENDEEKIKSSTVQYYDDLLGNLGYRIEDFDVIYSGADLIDSFFVYMDLKKSKPVIIESVPKQLDYESRVTGARRLKMVSDAYANLQEKSGFIDGSNILCSKLKYTTGEKDSDRNTFNMRKEINRVPEAYKTKISNICEINRDLDGSDILLMNSQGHCKYESGIGVEFQPVIYRTLVDYFSETPNITVKVHPESPVDVSQILTNAKAMGDFPIEFIAFTGIHFNNALSIDTGSADKMVEFGLVKKSIRVTKYFYKQFRLMPVLDFILDIDRYLGLNTNTSSFISDDVTRVLASQKTVNCNIPEYVSSCSVEGGNFRIQIGDVPGNEHLISKLKIEKNNDRSMGLFNDFVIEFECPLDISNKIRMFQYERTLENLGLKYTFELEK